MSRESTVFIIADDAAVRDALSISLSMDGLKLKVYCSGSAFLNAYTADRPGCLLMDLSVPELDCLAVQQALIRRNLLLPIIFLTDFGARNDSILALDSGAFCLLEKPVSRSLLVNTIHEAIQYDVNRRSTKNNKIEKDEFSSAGS
ncbi:MAG: response regulator [Methylococcales bacterium]